MPEPINPSDHSIGGKPVDGVVVPSQSFADRTEIHLMALAEAIHQTFERDAEMARADLEGDFAPSFPADPQTEIDRQARLIVDGEYRRRAEAKGANNG